MTKWIVNGDIINDQYYKFPKSFIFNPKYAKLPSTAMIIYAMLRDRLSLSLQNGYWDEDGRAFVYFTQDEMATLFHVTRQAISKSLKALKNVGLIETKRQGLTKPNKIYVAMPEPFVLKSTQNEQYDVNSSSHHDENLSSHQKANEVYTNKTEKRETDGIQTEKYIKKSGKPDVAPLIMNVVDYLNEKAGTKYKPTTPKTQKLIHAREKEGFTLDDFKTVIDKKCAEWLHDGDMVRYLRPETLFGTKFESYLNQKEVKRNARPYRRIDEEESGQSEYAKFFS
ncbi:conserved phage C-terminal domain-containing protein [uncultured Mitsuokella sp.]|uniref:conserved phage C-terminal domain-containing protein n=1 Tax=uncultured Mitsuokella sp. TaxID=453120 RepID=UPI0025FB76A2|nr:conserved phage C-terminal domain-containing protein [uncultured Mitsuokella sp.]